MDHVPLMAEAVALAPRLSRAEVEARLRGGGVGRWLGAPRRGRLVGLRQVYVPYRLFRVSVSSRGEEHLSWMALDTVTGRLDPYRFDSPPEPGAALEEGAALLEGRVPVDRLEPQLLERVRREVYLRGFFRIARLRLTAEDTGREVRVPYWVGVYAKGERVSIEVWNAVRRQREGAKLREVIEAWLGSRPTPP